MRTMFSKSLSLMMSLALVFASFPATAAPMAAAATPDFVTALTPSANLGHIESFYKGSTERPVVLIQDLHANVGVQRKIRSLLEFLQPQVAPTGRPMVLGIEGAWGELNLSNMRQDSMPVRKATADYLLKESEISGMDHFALLSESPVRLIGIDDPESYILHGDLFRKSLAARLSLAQKVDTLRLALNESKGGAPKALRDLWKLEENFHAGHVGLDAVSKKLKLNIATYKEAEIALSKAKSNFIAKESGDDAFKLKNITEADQQLSLLSRLLRQQLTMDEVQIAAKKVPAMLMAVRALMPGENMTLWADTIRTALDHYAVALVRDTPMAEHAIDLSQKNSDTSVVVIAGGFHTAGITSLLKAKKMSYVVIAPIVESHTLRDEQTYVKRMLDVHVSDAEVAAALQKKPSVPSHMIATAITTQIPQIGQRNPNLARMYNRVASLVRRNPNAVPTVESDSVQMRTSQAVDVLTTPVHEGALTPPSRLQVGLNYLRTRFGAVREYVLPRSNPDVNTTEGVTLEGQAEAASAAKESTGIPTGRLSTTTSAAITATVLAIPLADRITQASQTAAGMGINEQNMIGSALLVGALAAGTVAYRKFWSDPRKREETKRALARARVRMAA